MTTSDVSTLAAYALDRLRADLKANRFPPGERLRTDELQALYKVGLSPLREALVRLAEIGLVAQIGQRGFRVAEASLDDLSHILAARRFFEHRAVSDSLARGDDRWEADLVLTFRRLSNASLAPATSENSYQGWEQCHAQFHAALVSACSSDWLLKQWRAAFDQAERYRRLVPKSEEWFRKQVPEHQELLEAALARDLNKVGTLLQHHVGVSSELLGNVSQTVASSPAALSQRGPRARKTERRIVDLLNTGVKS